MDDLTDALRRALSDPRRALPPAVDPVLQVHRGIRRRRRRRAAAAGTSLALVGLAAGSALAFSPAPDGRAQQADDGSVLTMTPAPSPALSPTAAAPEPSAEPSPTGQGPAFEANTRPDTGGPEYPGNGLAVVDVRVARQDGFDRVVYELAGEGEVAWRVEYVEQAREQGSGDQVPLEGRSRLEVNVLGVGYPYDTGIDVYDGPRRVRGDGTPRVTEVVMGPLFEGQHQWFIGVSSDPRPFRVFSLSDPQRLVVDVRHD